VRGIAVVLLAFVAGGACSNNEATPPVTVPTPTSTPTGSVGSPTAVEATPTAIPAAPDPTATPPDPPAAHLEDAFPELPSLERPVVMVEIAGEETFLVALQEGRILAFAASPTAAGIEEVLDQRARTGTDGNEEGLLGLALDPGFAENGFIYVYYTAQEGARRSVVSRMATTGVGTGRRADPASELVIMEIPQPYANHNGGNMVFGPDGMLYIGLGDGGSAGDPQGNGQDTGTLLGSILRIDVSQSTEEEPYRVPADNPLVNVAGARGEIWAYGLRNPWRFSFDRKTGELWAGDVGQNAIEEIDVIAKGENYGWNVMEGTQCFRPATGCDQEGLELPVAEYDHSGGRCSVTGGYVYRGDGNPSLRGHYVFADFCSGEMWAMDAEQRSEVMRIMEGGPVIASFAEDIDGEVYALSFDGRIYRLAP
jgi:glucose/arabinose dehydrogenase